MSPEASVIVYPAIIAFIAYVGWKMNRIVQPMRIEMTVKADRLLARPDIPDRFRVLVEDNVRTAFGMRWRIVFGLVLVPFVASLFLFRQRYLRGWIRDYHSMAVEDREAFREVQDLHDRITYVNHFILFPILLIEIGVFMMPAVLLRAMLRGSLDRPGTADIVRGIIEHKRYELPRAHIPLAASC